MEAVSITIAGGGGVIKASESDVVACRLLGAGANAATVEAIAKQNKIKFFNMAPNVYLLRKGC
jgi:hypothetical protein